MHIVFTAYNRPRYLQATLASWAAVRGWQDATRHMFLEPGPAASHMLTIARLHGLAVHHNPVRHGVLHNPWVALQDAFATEEFAILAEDDIVVSDDILEYFTWARDRFATDGGVLAVCANTKAATSQDDNLVLRGRHFDPLVWGTWRDRWTDVLRDTWDHDYSSGTREHPQSGWDWNINLRVLGNRDVLWPASSRSNHIGAHAGTHTTLLSFPGSVSPTFRPHRPPAPFHL